MERPGGTRGVAGIPATLERRARQVLARLSVVSDGTTTSYDDARGQDDDAAREQRIDERIRFERKMPGERPPPKSRSLYDFYAWHFARASSRDRLFFWVLLAEEDLARARMAGVAPPDQLPNDKLVQRLLEFRGHPAEAAARHHVTMAWVRKVWRDHERDPESGEPWPRDPERRIEKALALTADGESRRRVAERTGVPIATLQRRLQRPR
jgi:hypothetical protein